MAMSDHNLKSCIALCWECRNECQHTLFDHCLEMGGKHAEAAHVRLMTDCIEMCQTAADFMVRHSELHARTCAACADVCEACARSCEAVGGDRMQACAEICRRCAESCRDMSRMPEMA